MDIDSLSLETIFPRLSVSKGWFKPLESMAVEHLGDYDGYFISKQRGHCVPDLSVLLRPVSFKKIIVWKSLKAGGFS